MKQSILSKRLAALCLAACCWYWLAQPGGQ